MAAKNTAKSKLKPKAKKAIAKSANKVSGKNKLKTPVKSLKKITTKPKPKTTARKAAIVKRVTFTVQEFKEVQQKLTADDCQNLKTWITKKMAEPKLPTQPAA